MLHDMTRGLGCKLLKGGDELNALSSTVLRDIVKQVEEVQLLVYTLRGSKYLIPAMSYCISTGDVELAVLRGEVRRYE